MANPLFEKVERIVISVACQFTIKGTDFSDLLKVSRNAAWEIIEKYRVTEQNLGAHINLISVAIKQTLKQTLSQTSFRNREFDQEDGALQNLLLSDAKDTGEIAIDMEATRAALIRLAKFSVKYRTTQSKQAVVRFLVYILQLKDDDIPMKLTFKTFVEYGLQRWLWVCFKSSPYRAINLAYPGQFLPCQMNWVTRNYWTGKVGKKRAIKMLQKVLAESGYPPPKYPKILSSSLFEERRLLVPLKKVFGWDRHAYLEAAFPGRYHPWEFSNTPKLYFRNQENVVKAVRWLVEEQLGYDMKNLSVGEIWDKRIGHKITKQVFVDHGLGKIVRLYGLQRIIEQVYPGKFLPWSFNSSGKWVGEKGKQLAAEATRWLIEEHLKIPPTSKAIDCEFFYKHGLGGMLSGENPSFNSSPKKVMENAYPSGYG